jgi:hypothetical protein
MKENVAFLHKKLYRWLLCDYAYTTSSIQYDFVNINWNNFRQNKTSLEYVTL